MQKSCYIMFLIMITVLSSFVYADSDFNYSELGFRENDYRSGEGEFNEDVSEVYKTKVLGSGVKYPIVSDFDNDGSNDIFVLDGQTAKIFNFDGSALILTTSFVLPTDERTSNIISFDIDGDNFTEIIFIQEETTSPLLWILEYNGTDFLNQSIINLSITVGINGFDAVIKCGGLDKCMAFWINNFALGTNSIMNTFNFSSTGRSGSQEIATDATGGDHFCFPHIKNMVNVDYDNDGEIEYIMSAILQQAGGSEALYIWAVTQNGTLEYEIIDLPGSSFLGAGSCSVDNFGRYITSPLVHDFVIGGNSEILIGANVNTDEYKMFLYNSVGCNSNDNCLEDDYPETFKADGNLLSNPILADVFSDSGITDFCVFGHEAVEQELTLLCGSENTNEFLGQFNSMEFVFSTDGDYNLSTAFDSYSVLGHSGQHKTQSIQIGFLQDTDSNPDEFISTYGVFEVTDDNFNGSLWRKTLTRIFENTRGESAIIPVDSGKLGANDLIALQSNNLIYIDDGLSKAPSRITFWEFNPCPVDSIIKINSTMDISVIVTDQNPDLIGPDPVSARITVYEGDDNRQNQTLINFTSGVEFQAVNFLMNKTIVNGNIKLEGWDTSHPTTIDTIDISFTVATNGIEFNDITCSEDLAAEVAAEAQAAEPDLITESAADNGLSIGLKGLAEQTGLSALIWWLMFMAFGAVFIFMGDTVFNKSGGRDDSNSKLGVIMIFEILMLIIGTLIGVVPVGIIIAVIVVVLIVLGLFLSGRLTGTNNNPG